MYFLEKMLKRRLSRAVGKIHSNELPIRHVITELDGATSSTNSFSGDFLNKMATNGYCF
jgi:hypothetical protein